MGIAASPSPPQLLPVCSVRGTRVHTNPKKRMQGAPLPKQVSLVPMGTPVLSPSYPHKALQPGGAPWLTPCSPSPAQPQNPRGMSPTLAHFGHPGGGEKGAGSGSAGSRGDRHRDGDRWLCPQTSPWCHQGLGGHGADPQPHGRVTPGAAAPALPGCQGGNFLLQHEIHLKRNKNANPGPGAEGQAGGGRGHPDGPDPDTPPGARSPPCPQPRNPPSPNWQRDLGSKKLGDEAKLGLCHLPAAASCAPLGLSPSSVPCCHEAVGDRQWGSRPWGGPCCVRLSFQPPPRVSRGGGEGVKGRSFGGH